MMAASSAASSQDSNLTNDDFLALGCLHFSLHDRTNEESTPDPRTWVPVETHEINPSDFVDSDAVSECISLIEASWIYSSRARVLSDREIWRIHILPNDVRCDRIDRRNRRLRKLLSNLIPLIDVSPQSWNGVAPDDDLRMTLFDPRATREESSLFYIFNTLPSPAPDPKLIEDPYLRHAITRLLDNNDSPWGLQSRLHPYQRRAAAMMLQREVAPQLQLDPRLESRTNPLGDTFYYGPRDLVFWRSPRYYDTVQGGILAETMGLGKTLIAIAAILATRGQTPIVPVQYTGQSSNHARVPPLTQLAAAAVVKTNLAWRTFFEDLRDGTGNDHTRCMEILADQRPSYDIPPRVIRSMRHASIYGDSEKVLLSSCTIIVVPPNLVEQWENELKKHVRRGSLKVLVLKETKSMVPMPEELLKYDIVLFSRRRFENENRQTDEFYVSPLKAIHWLRIIIDEGHGFSSSNTNAGFVADRLVRADRRWIMSGTPARDLLGVEVDLPGLAVSDAAPEKYRAETLEQRRYFDEAQERSSGAVKSIGALAAKYLKAQPWASSGEIGADLVNWDDYIYRHEDPNLRTYTGFAACLRSTLNNLVIKTRPEDVERDLQLPPLYHKVVRLQPSAIDKMTANLFVLLYTTNAVTSERRDRDYLFHPQSRAHLARLTTNLRQSAFFWSGFSPESILASIETAEKYLAKHEHSDCTEDDRVSLLRIIEMSRMILDAPVWRAASRSQDMIMFLNNWPDNNGSWLLDDTPQDLPVIGLTACIQAQKYVNNQLASEDPLQGLADAGAVAKAESLEETRKPETMARNGIPESSLNDAMRDKRLSVSGASRAQPKKSRPSQNQPEDSAEQSKPKPKPKRRLSHGDSSVTLPSDHPLASTSVVGTASSKFTYLVMQLAEIHTTEKSLVFYEGGHIAYYLSQALDLLHIPHLIYANTLSSDHRSKYAVLFDTDPKYRVLIIDIKQAAHGLNLSSASRVFFVNPPNRPDVEAQAVKRAHRIGQTRPVHVETLVLKGTVEEAIHDRAASMTKREHQLAAKALEEDEGIRGIIQNAGILPLTEEECLPTGQIAKFEQPYQLFGRPGRARGKAEGLEKQLFGGSPEQPKASKKRKFVVKFRLPGARATEQEQDEGATQDQGPSVQGVVQGSLFGG